jgi:hypothetical protein
VPTDDNRFVATGPAVTGFGTSATQIDNGVDVAGNKVGVRGTGGPVGVVGRGEDAGVRGTASGNGHGGEFSSSLFRGAQINLKPHRMDEFPGSAGPAAPMQFVDQAQIQRMLPSRGVLGDLWMSDTSKPDKGGEEANPPKCHLWLCVRASSSNQKARWAQVLLGTTFEGQHPLPVHP